MAAEALGDGEVEGVPVDDADGDTEVVLETEELAVGEELALEEAVRDVVVDAEGDADQLLVPDIEGVSVAEGDVVTDLVGEAEADGDCVDVAEAD